MTAGGGRPLTIASTASAVTAVSRAFAAIAAGFMAAVLVGCSGGAETTPTGSAAESGPADGPAAGSARTSALVGRITTPWDAAFLPGGKALVTLRDAARVVLVDVDGSVKRVPAGGHHGRVPNVVNGGEGGLLGIAVADSFERNHYVYMYRTTSTGNEVVRMTLQSGTLADPRIVLRGIESSTHHNGGGLGFGPDGKLYVSTGDAEQRSLSQKLGSMNGKILRINADGSVPDDNPFSSSPVYSLGHRNVEGFGWDGRGRVWASEFGENTWDELNLIRAGKNYGWPDVEGVGDDPKFVNPVMTWSTADASPSGVAVRSGGVYLAALRGERLWYVPFTGRGGNGESSAGESGAGESSAGESSAGESGAGNGESVGAAKAYFTGKFGRLRNVVVAPDKSMWLFTDNGEASKIIRVTNL
ncbi:PQQ-dependent sugar dehydrogenase [Spelaeicoccus albus]|uniref:Glucose/arabinose dehydrogenase n=1 Tax=Spelaeicoccus albus TaxID=1280376 RepID=A0A7Z0IHY8_9MICO|nr:PQQ-dependent sugar dehydrogenase [Spelaeicoccus albus]NYI68014.1 glucose/arabinose dehydrogenase [Spelaeicoccus albus]